MEEAQIQRFLIRSLGRGQIYLAFVDFRVVIIGVITGKSTNIYPAVLIIPLIDRQQHKALADAPGIRQAGHQRAIDHVPHLRIVLLFLCQHTKYRSGTLAHGVFAKFGKDVRFWHIRFFTSHQNIIDNLPNHVFVVELKTQTVADWHPSTNINGVQLFVMLPKLTVNLDRLAQFPPIVQAVFNPRIHKEVQQLKLKLRVILYFFFVKRHYLSSANTQARSIELEIGFFLRSHPNPQVTLPFNMLRVVVNFLLVITNRNNIFETVVDQINNTLQIMLWLKAIANNGDAFIDLTRLVQFTNQVDIKSGRSFQIYLLIKHLVQNVTKVVTLGTVAVVVLSSISQ